MNESGQCKGTNPAQFTYIKSGEHMYGNILGATTATVTTVAALTLPNTGSNAVVTIAISVAAGLLTWGVMHARSRRQALKG